LVPTKARDIRQDNGFTVQIVLFSGHVHAGQAALSVTAAAIMTKWLRLEGLVTPVDRLAAVRIVPTSDRGLLGFYLAGGADRSAEFA
jgi:hypothetical protein